MTSTITIQERQTKVTRWLLIPGIVWMSLFLVVPIAMIVYVSFWTQTTFTITSDPTLASWKQFFTSDTYTGSLWVTIRIWLIVLATVGLPAFGGIWLLRTRASDAADVKLPALPPNPVSQLSRYA